MLKHIDVLGPPVTLTIESNSFLKTYLGAIMSIFLFFTGIGAFFGFGIDIFYKEKPKVTFNRNINEGLPETIINDKNFLFTIYDQYSDKQIPDFNRRFSISFDYSYDINGTRKSTRRIPFEKCSEDALKLWDEYFSIVPREYYYCFPKGKNWPLKGIASIGNFTRIRMQLEYCQNNTDPIIGAVGANCIPKEDTVKLMQGKRIQMHYMIENWLINTFDFKNPGTKTAYTGYTNTDALSWSRLNIQFKEILSDTDEGYFVVSKKQEKFTAIEAIANEAIYSPETPAVFSHLIDNSRYKETYTRSYIKVQDVFAMMGGFLSAAHLIFRILVRIYVTPRIANIFNSIIKLEPIHTDLGNLNFQNLRERKSNLIFNTRMKNPNISENNLNLYNTELSRFNKNGSIVKKEHKDETLNSVVIKNNIKNISSKNFNLEIGFCERLFRLCYKKNEKSKIYESLTAKMLKFTSFENLLKLTKNNKILKSVIFNETLRYISNICLYPQKISKVAMNPDILQDNFVELVKENDYYAINLLNLNQFYKIPGNEENQKLNSDEIKSIQITKKINFHNVEKNY